MVIETLVQCIEFPRIIDCYDGYLALRLERDYLSRSWGLHACCVLGARLKDRGCMRLEQW